MRTTTSEELRRRPWFKERIAGNGIVKLDFEILIRVLQTLRKGAGGGS